MPDVNHTIQKAMQAVQEAVPNVQHDPLRPVFHFRPPARWMNDPNGTIYHNGWYHVFYQHHPFGDTHGPMYWGHTRSRDLVHWEHLPIALWPSHEKGETDCYSGCAWKDDRGRPILFYTKVDKSQDPQPPFEQWAAIPEDDDLINWQKHPDNPILTLNNGPAFNPRWRDPFIFSEQGRTFMVVGACGEEHGTPLYEATTPDLSQWIYRGKLCGISSECPNFARIGSRWIYLSSPYKPVDYHIGDFDLKTLTFTPSEYGILDHAGVNEKGRHINGFYASNLCFNEQCILFGWVRGWLAGRGWNGCLALPRLLFIGPDDRPRQIPVPELRTLRGTQKHFADIDVTGIFVLDDIVSDTFELLAVLEPGTATCYGISIRCDQNGHSGIHISCDGTTIDVDGVRFPFSFDRGEEALFLHIFHDKSVLEVFVNGGRAVVTRVVSPTLENRHIATFAEGGTALLRAADVWTLKSIW